MFSFIHQQSVTTHRPGEAEDPGAPGTVRVGPEAIRLNTSILAQQACQVWCDKEGFLILLLLAANSSFSRQLQSESQNNRHRPQIFTYP